MLASAAAEARPCGAARPRGHRLRPARAPRDPRLRSSARHVPSHVGSSSALSLGSTAIAANNAGIAVATNNVANVNTDGYSREPSRAGAACCRRPASTASAASRPARPRAAPTPCSPRASAPPPATPLARRCRRMAWSDLETTLAASPTSDKLATLFASLFPLASAPGDKTHARLGDRRARRRRRFDPRRRIGGRHREGDADQQVALHAVDVEASFSLAAQLAAANAAAQSGRS